MINVVFDTNVFIDGLIGFREDCEQIIDLFNKRIYRTLFSQDTIGELIYVSKNIANHEFDDKSLKINFLHSINDMFFFSKSINTLDVKFNLPIYCNDKFDDMFLECAVAGEADYLVTNDEKSGLLEIVHYPFRVITSYDFLEMINSRP